MSVINYLKIIFIVFCATSSIATSQILKNANTDSPIGFATVEADGVPTTTGGAGGDTVVVTTGDQLNELMLSRKDAHFDDNNPPIIILVQDTLHFTEKEMLDVKETYDVSIFGIGKNAVIEGFGLNVYRSHNIIIRNIEFRDCPDDAINVTDSLSHHVWIDHCTFSDSPDNDPDAKRHDGLLDIKHGACYVTVSWNHFYNHQKTCLLGNSDNTGDEDIGRLKVTYHHNWFDNTNSRHPRVRFGECHVFNNYYDGSISGMSYGIASTMEADVVVEANYFNGVDAPTHAGYAASDPGDLVEKNNYYRNSGNPETRGEAFDPRTCYEYTPDAAETILELVKTGAGAGKLYSTGINNPKTVNSRSFQLNQNFPNPFNPQTQIIYELYQAEKVELAIFDLLGRKIDIIFNGHQKAGKYEITWKAIESSGNPLPSGTYWARLKTETGMQMIKMSLIR